MKENKKKTVSPIITVILLLMISVIAAISFQNWFKTYSSSIYVDLEKKDSFKSTSIEKLINGILYIKSFKNNITITKIKIDKNECNISVNLSKGINSIPVDSCLNNISTNIPNIIVVTEDSILSKTIYIENKSSNSQSGSSNLFAKVFSGKNSARGDVGFESQSGFVIAGHSDITNPSNYIDAFLLKLDLNGNELWNKTYPVSLHTEAENMIEVSDGYVIVGGSNGWSNYNCLIIKIDFNGNVVWQKEYGSSSNFDICDSVVKDNNGNLLVLGTTKTYGNGGSEDIWLFKFDQNGNQIWNRTYGTNQEEWGEYITTAANGDILIVSDQNLWAGSGYNPFLIRLSSDGIQLWNKTYDYAGNDDHVRSIYELSNGNILIFGYANDNDYWVIKVDNLGNSIWNKTYGGTGNEVIKNNVFIKNENEIFIPGYTTTNSAGGEDFWVLKIDSNGNQIWNKTYGGVNNDEAFSISSTSDGGLLITGYTQSYGTSSDSIWVIKTDSNGNTCDYVSGSGEC